MVIALYHQREMNKDELMHYGLLLIRQTTYKFSPPLFSNIF